jgi:hypothetical protein
MSRFLIYLTTLFATVATVVVLAFAMADTNYPAPPKLAISR